MSPFRGSSIDLEQIQMNIKFFLLSMYKLGDLMTASCGHLIWCGIAARPSIIRAKSLPEKLSSATSNAARFEPRDFLAILKPSVRMKNHYTKDLLIECCDHVLVKRVFPSDTHFGFSKFYQNPTFCHANRIAYMFSRVTPPHIIIPAAFNFLARLGG